MLEEFIRHCKTRNIAAIRQMIENGFDIETKNRNGNRPINVACNCVFFDAVKLLMESGAEIDFINALEATPLSRVITQYTLSEEPCEEGEVSYPQDECIRVAEYILNKTKERGISPAKLINVTIRDAMYGSLVHQASRAENPEMLKLLLRYNPRIDIEDRNNHTPLIYLLREAWMHIRVNRAYKSFLHKADILLYFEENKTIDEYEFVPENFIARLESKKDKILREKADLLKQVERDSQERQNCAWEDRAQCAMYSSDHHYNIQYANNYGIKEIHYIDQLLNEFRGEIISLGQERDAPGPS